MAQLFICPCCGGQGVMHGRDRDAEDALLECVECDGSGKVDARHRDDLLEWQHRCRTREVPPKEVAATAKRSNPS